MYKRLEEVSQRLPRHGDVLTISHSEHLCRVLSINPDKLVSCNFPEFNILNLPFEDSSFDFVLTDQVFEHIEGNPQNAVDETLRVLKPGGYVLHTTCMMTGIHGPGDYWRFTPEGLAYLCRNAAQIIEVGGSRHPLVPLFTFLGFTWISVPDAKWHPMHYFATLRRDSYPFVVWVLAQK